MAQRPPPIHRGRQGAGCGTRAGMLRRWFPRVFWPRPMPRLELLVRPQLQIAQRLPRLVAAGRCRPERDADETGLEATTTSPSCGGAACVIRERAPGDDVGRVAPAEVAGVVGRIDRPVAGAGRAVHTTAITVARRRAFTSGWVRKVRISAVPAPWEHPARPSQSDCRARPTDQL